jgi:hypothetical protein
MGLIQKISWLDDWKTRANHWFSVHLQNLTSGGEKETSHCLQATSTFEHEIGR